MSETAPYLSVVVPVFNEEDCLPALFDRLGRALDPIESVEVILVNDGSSDRSVEMARDRIELDPRFVLVDLTRNFGQHAAVFAGFEQARGQVVITLDADLQNPPEEIPRMLAEIEKGYDVVGSIRQRRKDSWLRSLASRCMNGFTARVTSSRLTDNGCMLRAYRRSVVDAMCASGEISSFIPVLSEIYAGRVTEIPVAHEQRHQGESKYSLWQLIRLMLDLTTSFTLAPLRVAMVAGFVLSGLAMVTAVVLIGGRFVFGSGWAVDGVFTIFAVVFFFLGAQLFTVGLLGEYVGRIYLQVRGRPRFLVRKVYSKTENAAEGERE